jgi:hypothetical protein
MITMTDYMAKTTDKLLQYLETVDDIGYFLCSSSSTFSVSTESAILIRRKMFYKIHIIINNWHHITSILCRINKSQEVLYIGFKGFNR